MEDRGLPADDDSNEKASPQAAAGESAKAPSTPAQRTTYHADAPKSAPLTATPKSSYTLEDANEEIVKLIKGGKTNAVDVPALKAVLKEHASLKDKVDKLKSLLGRSAKAQRETKVDLEATQKRLSQALRETERLNQKLDKLQSRPTHCKFCRTMECRPCRPMR